MPRARFAKAVSQVQEPRDRASVREALWFDIRRRETSEEESLAEWRTGNFDHAALLLGATHLLIAAAFVALHPQLLSTFSIANPLVPLTLLLILDVVAALGLYWRDRLELAPHRVARAMCIYLGAVGLLWTLFSVAIIVHPSLALTSAVWASLCAGIAMAAIVSISSPPLSVVNAFVATAAAALFASATPVPIAVAILCMMLTAYSVAGSRTVIAAARRRLNLDSEARKALNFVDEFENTGRGWFWEINAEGTSGEIGPRTGCAQRTRHSKPEISSLKTRGSRRRRSSSRSPRACSWRKATAPTKLLRASRSSACGWRSTISAPATAHWAI